MERGGLTHENLYEHALRLPVELDKMGVRVREHRHWTAKAERENYNHAPQLATQGLLAGPNQ